MSYVALYRKWRPKVFEDVVGQQHITQTLKNQIKNENIAHAYLFCGTRGTGKTSTAKIFARAVNCLNPKDYDPCNECEICTGIQHESIMDVIEIDAASNNGVDDIRELRENVKYPPTKGRYKVYIIDEVHMLSTGAFNALLKTLEEPPSYVIFILATTEPHKIPATIHSRCQRFDFKRVKEGDIVNRMAHICHSMNIEVQEEALKLIARNADGAMRDALSILDQCVSFGTGKITYDDVINILGTVSDEFIFNLVDYITDGNSKNAIELIEELISSGKDIQQFIKDFIEHYRNLMMTKVSNKLEGIINLSRENIDRLIDQGKRLEINAIIRAIKELSQTAADAKWATQPRILLEVAVVKLSQPMFDQSIEGLIERVSALEKIIRSGKIKVENVVNEEIAKDQKDVEQEKELENIPKKENLKPINFDALKKGWDQILKVIKKRKISVYAVLMEGQLVKVEKNTLIVAFKHGFGFHKEAAGKNPYKEFIESVIAEMVGQKVQLQCVMEDELDNILTKEDEGASEEDMEVQKIIELFGEDMVEILE
ncbi:DNA polymerase III subunit gamma/tau [Crassaminicella thermophila]|uniref:DNA-directed DNA polymerase n=1 Tax=Crassaminicella thermophila TaxID=2599308 RepID=A0A5C0SIY9_CRATE|nr:DNA polymerase III subunit gamma/tau [Crassaminicella thermophila]QEK13414.1 DNA polymerase III subunit gamma/tau [Crassaminicella thermophila]